MKHHVAFDGGKPADLGTTAREYQASEARKDSILRADTARGRRMRELDAIVADHPGEAEEILRVKRTVDDAYQGAVALADATYDSAMKRGIFSDPFAARKR